MSMHVLVGVAGGIPEPLLRAQSVAGKFFLMFFAIALFAVVFGLVLFFASLFKGRTGEKCPGRAVRRPRDPAARLRPDVPRDPHHHPVVPREVRRGLVLGRQLRRRCSPSPSCCSCCATPPSGSSSCRSSRPAIGLVYAILIDRARGEAFAKALIFLPMAISMVGAQHHLEVRLPVQADLPPADRPAQRHPQGPRVRDPAVPHQRATEHLHADRRHGLDPGRLRDDRALGRHQGDPRRDHRGRQARRRAGLQDVPVHHPAEHPPGPRRRHHDDRHRHAEGLRHRPNHDRRPVRHLGGRQRVLQPELPLQRRRPRRGPRRAAVRARHPDRHLQHPSRCERRPEP